ncbi:hypothetical protein INT44_000691 [Umbelopsis vinacea]|uniref:Exonuclease domain-containing protein n=1 Tax=Umbelopsis vinacea TaxID=44442 RepID=A0A8H7UJ78_9FUNG|nr:hypothetical protein INT44_000691 [Umbelopsis vinacea]
MVCVIDTSKTVPFGEPTTITPYISATSDPFSKNDPARVNDVRINVKPPLIKRRRQRKKEKVTLPCGSFLISLNKPCQDIRLNLNELKDQLTIKDLRLLLLSWLADGARPSWIQLKRSHHIRRFVVVHAPALNSSSFDIDWNQQHIFSKTDNLSKTCSFRQQMPFSSSLFDEVISLKLTMKSHPVAEFCQCSISNSERQRRAHARRANLKSTKLYTVEQCILSLDEMLEAGYPIHSSLSGHTNIPSNWVETHKKSDLVKQNKPRLIALDCEMCLTPIGLELARISLIDEDMNTIMDEMVQPSHPIIDYLTRYSGIREEHLVGVTTSLQDIQQKLLDIIDQDTILVGHSLECDLKTLKLAHPNVIDTARLYHHRYGPPLRPSLKYLAARWLNRIIQSDEDTLMDNLVVGHDSCVDAATSMELVSLKLARGPDFGLYFSSTESIFSRLERCRPSRLGAIFETSGSSRHSPFTKHAKAVKRCDTEDQLVDEVIDAVGCYDFVWASLQDHSLNQPVFDPRIQLPVSPKLTSEDSKINRYCHTPPLSSLDGYVQKIWSNLPAGTVLVVIGATKSDDRVSRSPPPSPTSETQEGGLNNPMDALNHRAGICLLTLK